MILLLLAAATLAPTVDHVTVAGRDIREIRAAFQKAGFRTEYGGPHANGLTEMDIISFRDGSYIELMAIGLGATVDDRHYWGPYLNGNAGPCAWAARSADVQAEVARLEKAGIAVTAPESSGRTRSDGFRLRWETAGVGPGRRGTFFPFLIRDLTEREKRVYPQGKPTMPDYAGVSRVVLAVKDLAGAVKQFRDAYALPEPEYSNDGVIGAHVARFPGTVIALAEPSGSESAVGEHLRAFGPSAFAFVIRKGEQSQALRWMRPNGWWIGLE